LVGPTNGKFVLQRQTIGRPYQALILSVKRQ